MAAELIHRDVKAQGVRLRVSECGSGPSLLLLHGLFVDHSSWLPMVESLSRDFRVVAPDLPGFGQSEKPPEGRFHYDIGSFANAVIDLYAGLGLGRAILVGHGLGGAIAITLAARHPELASSLVLMDSLCYPTRVDIVRQLALAPLVGGFAFKQLWGRSAFRAYFRESIFSQSSKVPFERVDHYYDTFNTPAARASALATLRATRDTRAVVADIARISTRTLVLWGKDDRLYPASLGQRMSREIRHCGFHLLSTGHSPQEEAPADVAQSIRRFCDSAST